MRVIIRLTFLEMLKKKVLLLSLIMTVVFLALYGFAIYMTYGSLDDENATIRFMVSGQLLSLGIYSCGLIVSFLSIFTSISIIASEVESGTLDAIMAKPISRMKIIMGKYIGTLIMLMAYSVIMISSVIALNRILSGGFSIVLKPENIVLSISVFLVLPILISSIGTLLSTKLPTIGSAIVLIIVYFIGMIGGTLESIGTMMTGPLKDTLINIGIVSSLIIPTDVIYRKASTSLFPDNAFSSLASGLSGVSTQPSGFMVAYIAAFIGIMICLSIRTFSNRDT